MLRQPDDPGDYGYPPRSGGGFIIFICYLSICLSIVGLVFIAWVLLTGPASAHDAPPTPQYPLGWKYPWACCSNMDCGHIDGGKDISETSQGYVIKSTGEVVAYGDKRIKDSPDGEFHWCAHRNGIDAGHTICLFVPPKGF